jgi:hypothetical protein
VAKKKRQEKGYLCKIKISAKKKREIEICANAKGVSVNRFIKNAINQTLSELNIQTEENTDTLRNQLDLFDIDALS